MGSISNRGCLEHTNNYIFLRLPLRDYSTSFDSSIFRQFQTFFYRTVAIRNVFPVPSVKTRIFHRRTFMDSSWRISLNFLAIYDARVNYPLIGCVPIHSEFEIEKNVAAVFVLFSLFVEMSSIQNHLSFRIHKCTFDVFVSPFRLRIIMSWLMIWIQTAKWKFHARCPCTILHSRHECVEPVVFSFSLLLLLLSQLFRRFQLFRHQ